MRYKLSLIIQIIGLFILSSCQNKSTNFNDNQNCILLNLDECEDIDGPLHLSQIADKTEYTSLESRNNSFLTQTTNLKFSNKYILIGQRGQIKQFNHSGKFIRDLISVGRGPDEGFSRCFDVFMDQLFMYNNFTHEIIIYDLDSGKVLSRFKDPITEFATEGIFIFKNYLVSIALNGNHNFFFKVHEITNLNNVLDWPITYKTEKRSLNTTAAYSSVYLQNFKDTLIFKEMFSDTIFHTIEFLNLKPRYILKYHEKFTYDLYQQYLSSPKSTNVNGKLLIGRFIENSRFLFLAGYLDSSTRLYLYDKKNKKLKSYNSFQIINDLDGGFNFKINWDPKSIIVSNNKMYCLIDPSEREKLNPGDIKSSSLLTILSDLNEFSNPVLMTITLPEI